jgi:Na+-transporting methylmalonyl-CoA/oxaloacetate decarboxylase gamma subunit
MAPQALFFQGGAHVKDLDGVSKAEPFRGMGVSFHTLTLTIWIIVLFSTLAYSAFFVVAPSDNMVSTRAMNAREQAENIAAVANALATSQNVASCPEEDEIMTDAPIHDEASDWAGDSAKDANHVLTVNTSATSTTISTETTSAGVKTITTSTTVKTEVDSAVSGSATAKTRSTKPRAAKKRS